MKPSKKSTFVVFFVISISNSSIDFSLLKKVRRRTSVNKIFQFFYCLNSIMSISDFSEQINHAILTNSIGDLDLILKEVIESDLSLESVVNYPNVTKQTSLHLAAIRLQDELIRLLLLSGSNANAQDVHGHTPVMDVISSLQKCHCISCVRKAVRGINYLGEFEGDMNTANNTGGTPLHLSAILGLEVIALALLNNGATLSNRKNEGNKPMTNILLEYMPDIILPIFDRTIKMDYKQRHLPNFCLEFDMSVLLTETSNCSCGNKDPNAPRREMGFLRQILKSSFSRDAQVYSAILEHPIVHVFTDIKWDRLKYLYFAYLAFQINLLMWYLLFLSLVIFIDCPVQSIPFNQSDQSNINQTSISPSMIENLYITSKCDIRIYTKLIGFYVLLCTFASACKEVCHLVTDFWSYVLDIFNYAHWIGIVTVSATAIIVLDPIALFHFWLFPLAAFGIGICWIQLFLHLGQMPKLAIYVDMLSKVTVNFCISLGMYSCIILAFAMSYCMLFPSNTRIADLPFALLRVLTMMLGELNFETLFSPEQWFRSPFLAHLWYAISLVVISMVLMNLLVGLAVSDISGCRKHSQVVVMKRKIRYLNYLEKTFYLGTLFTPKCVKNYLRNRVGVIGSHENSGIVHCKPEEDNYKEQKKYTVNVYPNKAFNSRFLSDTTTAIRQWIIKQENCDIHRETFCRRDDQKFQHHHFPRHKSGSKEPINVRPGSSLSVSAKSTIWKRTDEDGKRITKMENSLKRLETRFLEFDSKLDDVLSIISKSN